MNKYITCKCSECGKPFWKTEKARKRTVGSRLRAVRSSRSKTCSHLCSRKRTIRYHNLYNRLRARRARTNNKKHRQVIKYGI